jgi:hypothetical protein
MDAKGLLVRLQRIAGPDEDLFWSLGNEAGRVVVEGEEKEEEEEEEGLLISNE